MKGKKLLIILPLILSLFLTGYTFLGNGKAQAVQEEEEIEGEKVTEIGEKAEELLEKLEKKELTVKEAPASLVITPKGKTTLVNADLVSVATTTTGTTTTITLVVKIFGLNLTVDASEAKIIGGSGELSVSDLKIGDKLLVKGVIDANTGVIKASRIQDRSLHKETIGKLREKIQELLKLIGDLRSKLKIF